MVLPDTALVVCPDVDGVSFSASWGAGDEVAERWWEIYNWDVHICNMYFSRGHIIITVYIVRNN